MSTASHAPIAAVTVAVEGEVHADLADAAERHEDEFVQVAASSRPAVAAAPKCTSPALIVRDVPSATAHDQPAIVVDRLERAARRPRRRACTAIGAPRPAARSSQRTADRRKAAAAVPERLLLDPGLRQRQEQRLGGRRRRRRRRATSPDRARPPAHAARSRRCRSRRWSCLRARLTASSRMPATLAPSSRTSFGHLSRSRAAAPGSAVERHARARCWARSRGSPLSSARPAAKPSVAEPRLRSGSDEEQARGEVAARRLPGAGRGGRGPRSAPARRPRAGRDRRPSPGRAPRVLVEPIVVVGGEPIARRRAPWAERKSHAQKRLCAAAPGRLDERRGDDDEDEHQDAGDAEHGAQLGGTGSKRPAGSSKYMILTMRR